jgi:hypothetical protein
MSRYSGAWFITLSILAIAVVIGMVVVMSGGTP